MTEAQPRGRPVLAMTLAVAVVCVGVFGLTMSSWSPLVKPLAVVLAVCALVAELIAARHAPTLTLSAAFLAAMLAVAFLGPTAAFWVPTISYVGVWIVDRYRWQALLINVAGSATPVMLAAFLFDAIDPPNNSFEFIAVLALVATATMAVNL